MALVTISCNHCGSSSSGYCGYDCYLQWLSDYQCCCVLSPSRSSELFGKYADLSNSGNIFCCKVTVKVIDEFLNGLLRVSEEHWYSFHSFLQVFVLSFAVIAVGCEVSLGGKRFDELFSK